MATPPTPSPLLLLLLVALTGAQVVLQGRCPHIPPMKDFDPHRFLGRWYEIERYFVSYEHLAGICWVENYLFNPSRGHYTRLDWKDRLTGLVLKIENGITFGKEEPGRIQYVVERPNIPILRGEYLLLATDYHSFALAWQCKDLPLGHTEILWFLSRQQFPRTSIVKNAKHVAHSLGLDVSLLERQDRRGCPP